MNMADSWYAGAYAEFRFLPWQHEQQRGSLPMPWKVFMVVPVGYIVYEDANGQRFKMLVRPAVVDGDVIE